MLPDTTRMFYASVTTGEQCFAVRAYRTAKASNRTTTTLPCVHARQRRHGKVVLGNEDVAVRLAKMARQKALPCVPARCRALLLCRASPPLPCANSLPCVVLAAVRVFSAVCRARCRAMPFAVRPPCLFAVRRAPARTAKALPGKPSGHPDAQVCATWCLCRVYAHGKVTKWSFAMCIHTAKTPQFSRFFSVFL
jgi:hypothetical protein